MTNPSPGDVSAAFLISVGFIGLLAWGFWETGENNAETVAHRETLPSMERAGEVLVNNTTLYLWKFDFEGQKCLWAISASSARGGLTCWKETP